MMPRSVPLWGLALCAVWHSVALAQNTTLKVVNVGNTTYQSNINLDVGVTSFLGIRYAAPPVGQPSTILTSDRYLTLY